MSTVGTFYLYEGQDDKAIAYLEKALELDPQNSFYLDNLGLAHMRKGMVEQGPAEVVRAAEMSMEQRRDLVYAYVKAGRPEEARKILAGMIDSRAAPASATDPAGVYAALGEKEKEGPRPDREGLRGAVGISA